MFDSLRAFFGGLYNVNIEYLPCYLVFLLIHHLFNVESQRYLIPENAIIILRYKNIYKYLSSLTKIELLMNTALVVSSTEAHVLSLLVCNEPISVDITTIFQALLLCGIISQIEHITLMLFAESSFIVSLLFSLLLLFINQRLPSIVSIFPVPHANLADLLISIAVKIILQIGLFSLSIHLLRGARYK